MKKATLGMRMFFAVSLGAPLLYLLMYVPIWNGKELLLTDSIAIMIFAFICPAFYPYSYEEQIRGSENLSFMEYSEKELERIEAGEDVFPHVLGTDNLGRDLMIRTMMGSRISLLVGMVASVLILIIGSIYGACAGYFGGKVDIIMMRIVDII